MTQNSVLSVEGVKIHFPVQHGWFFNKKTQLVKAVDGITLDLKPGETLGLVGESGCGKSTFGRAIMRLYPLTKGKVVINGHDISDRNEGELRSVRNDFQMIFQDPFASLNPRMTVFEIIAEPLLTHGIVSKGSALETEVHQLMEKVGLSPRFVKKYPHEFSGGQRQRIAIARALAIKPKVIVCDEPVSALDVSIQAQILNLLKELQRDLGVAYVFIAHDISSVRHISDEVAVMYLGKIVERARTDALFNNPKHPYTKALLSAVPLPDPKKERARERILLKGDLPSPISPPPGCAFQTRCLMAQDKCRSDAPLLEMDESGHEASCHFLDPVN